MAGAHQFLKYHLKWIECSPVALFAHDVKTIRVPLIYGDVNGMFKQDLSLVCSF